MVLRLVSEIEIKMKCLFYIMFVDMRFCFLV